jgi:hypothetical protein
MLSYHNDANLKGLVVAEMRKHQESDQFIKGAYERLNGKFKGCAVGCTIDSLNIILCKSYKTDDHKVFEEAIGVPEWLARLQDLLFERLPIGGNSQFAVDFLEAIPVGINLDRVKWKFCSFILKEGIDRMLSQPNLSDELREQVVNSMRGVLSLHESAINTGEWNIEAAESARLAAEAAAWSVARSAWSAARSAAWSAAWSAWSAESAARSAAESAESAAWSARSARSVARSAEAAAESAAESAAYKRYAGELIRLLKEER